MIKFSNSKEKQNNSEKLGEKKNHPGRKDSSQHRMPEFSVGKSFRGPSEKILSLKSFIYKSINQI